MVLTLNVNLTCVYANSHGQRMHFAWTKYPTKYKNQTHITFILIKNLTLVLSSIFRFSFVSFYRLQTTLLKIL